jgi:NIMA (never in mitosis gene a)-related kinase
MQVLKFGEVLKSIKDEPYSFKSDIWSLGCIIYELASLRPPFRAKSLELLFEKV